MCYLRVDRDIYPITVRDLRIGGLSLPALLAPCEITLKSAGHLAWDIVGRYTGKVSVIRRWETNYRIHISIYEKPWWVPQWWIERKLHHALEGL